MPPMPSAEAPPAISPLMVAADAGATADILAAIIKEQNINVNEQDMNGLAALHAASANGHTETAKALVGLGADVNIKNKLGRTPLHWAVRNKHVETSKALVKDMKANVDPADNDQWTPLFYAADSNQTELMKALVSLGANVNITNKMGMTVLHWTSFQKNEELSKILVSELKADPTIPDMNKKTPVHYMPSLLPILSPEQQSAIEKAFESSKKSRLPSGMRVDTTGSHGSPELGSAKLPQSGKPLSSVGPYTPSGRSVRQLSFTDSPATPSPALQKRKKLDDLKQQTIANAQTDAAVKTKHLDILATLQTADDVEKALADAGIVDASTTDKDGWSALHLSCANGDERVSTALVNKLNLDVNCQNIKGNTPLHMAVWKGQTEMVELMTKHLGADIHKANNDGDTPLHWSAMYGQIACTKALIRNGSDVRCRNKTGSTALHWAAFNSHPDVVDVLLANDEELIDAQNDDGNTPLLFAGVKKDFDLCLKLATEYGADTAKVNKAGITVYEYLPKLRAAVEAALNESDISLEKPSPVSKKASVVFNQMSASSFHNQLDSLAFGASPENSPVKPDVEDSHLVHSLLKECGFKDAHSKDQDGNTALHLAARTRGQVRVVRALVKEYGADPNSANKDGWTPLHFAAENGNDEAVAILSTDLGANVNATSTTGMTPLHWAACSGHSMSCATLVRNGAEVNTQDGIGSTPLHRACMTKNPATAIALVRELGADVNARDFNGWTVLHMAAEAGNVEMAKTLVREIKVDVNATDTSGMTAFHLAAVKKNTEFAIELVKSMGANGLAKDNERQTGFDYMPYLNIALSDYKDRAQRARKEAIKEVQAFVCSGDEKATFGKIKLDDLGDSINSKDSDGWSILHFAAFYGRLNIVKRLFKDFKAHAMALDRDGVTPIHRAAANGHTHVTECLIKEGHGNPNVKEKDGWTPLHYAAHQGHAETAKKLIELGADAHMRNKSGATALHLAAEQGKTRTCRMLVKEQSLSVNATDKGMGMTPIHYAASFSRTETIVALAKELSADVNATDAAGLTIFDYLPSLENEPDLAKK